MKELRLLEKTVVMENPDSLHNYFAWPTVATLEDGTLAAVASGYRFDHVCPFGKSVISYSRTGGKTWTPPAPVIDTVLDDRDAGILPFGEGNVIFTSFNNSLAFQKRNAGERQGANMDYMRAYIAHAQEFPRREEAAIGSTFKFSRDGGYSWEKVMHRSPVTSPHGPMVTEDGRLLYIGNVFGAPKPKLECWEIHPVTGEMRKVGDVPPVENGTLPSEEPHAIALRDGRILLLIRTERQPEHPTWENAYTLFTVYQSVSEDGGKTFTVPKPLTMEDASDDPMRLGAPPHLFRHSSGKLLLSTAMRTDAFGINILVSENEGESWEVYTLTKDVPPTADLGYPATAELPDGSLYTVWYQHTAMGAPAVICGAHWNFD